MAKIPKKYLPIAGILFLFLIIGYFLLKPGDKRINNTAMNELTPAAGLTGKNLHFVEDHPDKGTKWVMDVDEATSSQDKRQISLSGVRLKLESLDGSSMEINGNTGDYDKNLGEIRLKGDIHGFSDDGYNISTESIVYNQEEGVLKTADPVTMTGPFFSVSGTGFLFYPEKETFKIISNVKTTIELKKGL
jgi:LPS export ABC transporter protein LptC